MRGQEVVKVRGERGIGRGGFLQGHISTLVLIRQRDFKNGNEKGRRREEAGGEERQARSGRRGPVENFYVN